ncbi:MAG: VOC family protein [Actinomycetota bacterium]|nr:VOC family protein [Actinomycetota bacterium]
MDDLDKHLADLLGRGLAPGGTETANKNVRLAAITDPDGNRITFIGNFRIKY